MESQLRDILGRKFESGWQLAALLNYPGSPSLPCVVVRDRKITIPLLTTLRDHSTLMFNQLIDLTAVDYLYYPAARERFAVIYSLLSHQYNLRLWVKVMLEESDPSVASVCEIWPAADWMEREVHEMFGIRFDGHPNLKHLLLPDHFEHFPLRKEYPDTGLGERNAFPRLTREDA